MSRFPFLAALVLIVALLAGCGDGTATDESTTSSTESTTTSTDTSTSTSESSTTVESSTTTTTTASTTSSTSAGTTTTTEPVELGQPAIWPAPEVVFTTPEAAATDFMTKVFGFSPNLGEFMQGDSRSGEIEVYFPGESGGGNFPRSVLLLRQLGPNDGWFILAAVNSANTIDSPVSMATVAAGPITVSGEGRGFEGLVVIEAFPAGSGNRIDQKTAQAGSLEDTEPYSVTLDLSGATSGDTVLILVRGGVGLETDPGEFSAIPVVIS